MGFLRSYAVVALLLAVAGVQLFQVETRGLTRWKGGGFGMYSEPHPNLSRVWLGRTTTRGLVFRPAGKRRALRPWILRCQRWISADCLDSLAEASGLQNLERVQLWRPRVDPRTLEYRRELVAESPAS